MSSYHRLMKLVAVCLGLVSLPVQAQDAPRPQAAAFDHPALQVADLDKSVAFYRSIFDFEEVAAPFPGARWLKMANGIVLHIVGRRTRALEHPKWIHFAVACDDMDAMIALLDARGVPWSDIQDRRAPQLRPDGVKQIFVRDPDGYWIEINDALKRR